MLVAAAATEELHKNPIRKVVSMLENMKKSVEEEGKKEQGLFDKFMCYCSNGAGALETAIASGQSSSEALSAKIDSETALKSQLLQDVKQHKADREAAAATIKESTEMREKEAEEFAASSGEMKGNLAAMDSAVAALKKGLGVAMLQTSTASFLRNLIQHSPAVHDDEREMLLSFLDSSNGEEAQAGGSDQIIGIVETMRETMKGDLEEATSTEAQAKAAFETLSTTKTEEIAAASKAIESKTVRSGEVAVSLTDAKAELENTEEALAKDAKFKAELKSSCATKQSEWDARSKTRAEEIAALSETIEMLNDDDALDLFKKTMPSPGGALVQFSANTQALANAQALIRRLLARDHAHSVNLKMILLALKSKSQGGGLGAVAKMIDNMIAVLVKEQADDDKKKDYCNAELHTAGEEEKALSTAVHEVETSIAEKEDDLESMKSDIAALQSGIEALDKMVAEATEQRKEAHEDYTGVVSANGAALQLLEMATNRMQKFYNPSLYKAPVTTTVASSPYGLVQISQHSSAFQPGPAPETFSGEYKKSGESSGVLALMAQMIKDVEMDTKEAEHEEKTSQADYTDAMADAAGKRSGDSKLIVEKESAKASLAEELASERELRASKREQLSIAGDKLNDLHRSCDTFLAEYDDKKKDRATESDSLKESKAVLAGAGFIQKK